jgi:hypothetical protein
VELYLHSTHAPPWRGARLKHSDNFTFTFTSIRSNLKQSMKGDFIPRLSVAFTNLLTRCYRFVYMKEEEMMMMIILYFTDNFLLYIRINCVDTKTEGKDRRD